MTKQKVARVLCIAGLGVVGPMGCAVNRVRPIDSALFLPQPTQQTLDSSADADPRTIAEAIPPDGMQGESPKNASVLPTTQPRPFESLKPLDPLEQAPTTQPVEVLEAPASPAPTATVADSSATPSAGTGVYMTLGGVLVQVNNTPIYAGQVLAPLRKELAAKAREDDPAAFKDFAETEIHKQLDELIQDELDFATGYNALSDDDRKLADAIAVQIRQEKVTAAGGSVERARRQAMEDGQDFDDLIKQEYRHIVHGLYRRRKIEPLIQVRADDMRDDYNHNLSKLYSEKDKAQFRVLEIDPAKCGGMGMARDKINSIRERAIHGEDFIKLASTENQNDFLKGRGGNPCDDGGWMERNTYRFDAVEAAVWKLQPGQITPVIETEGMLFIAKLEARHLGTVKPFEDQTVQADIYNRLYQQQLGQLWQKSRGDSLGEAIVTPSSDQELENRLQIAVDMAMQTYAQSH
jgi:parvulin-like peptidyl-prolyl isomerase